MLSAVLVIVEDDAPVDRGRLTRLAERGPDSGVHVMWVATDIGAVAESGVSQLVTASLKADQWVIGESETSTWSSAWSLAQPFKSGRRGLLMNPGDIEGDSLLSTSLGRVSPQFIPGRGYIVGRDKARKLQIALAPENRD